MKRKQRSGGACPSLRCCAASVSLAALGAAAAAWRTLSAWGAETSASILQAQPELSVRSAAAPRGDTSERGAAAAPLAAAKPLAKEGGRAEEAESGERAETARGQPAQKPKYKIFTYWNYPGGASPFVQLNIDSWRAHSPPGTEVVFVNDTNFNTLVPDAPEEWYRLPYPASKSDVVRAAVLYHHGGLYMDTDFMALGPLEKVFAKLDEGWDVVAYTDGKVEGEKSGDCSNPKDRYSSNFLAAQKGNPWSRTWWSNIKMKLTRLCGEGELEKEKVCCHEAFSREPERRPCHIPWAQLEHLKSPDNDHDKKGPPRDDPTKAKLKRASRADSFPEEERRAQLDRVEQGNRALAVSVPSGTKLYCFRGPEGMAAHACGQIYWQPWDPVKKRTRNELKGAKYKPEFDCFEEDDGDLNCAYGNWGKQPRVFQRFFNRVAYHLFFSTHKGSARSKDEILKEHWLLSEMYRRGFASPST